jgi:cytochrome c peroxidase
MRTGQTMRARAGYASFLGACIGVTLAFAVHAGTAETFDASVWRAAFARPTRVPAPADNPTTPEKVALGRSLFEDSRLSRDRDLSCATCHDAALSFSDGVARRLGNDGELLPRRTPPLWNLAWGLTFFWDGRASSLEDQAGSPVENPREMAGSLAKAVEALGGDRSVERRFAAAFPEDPDVTETNIRKALAAYERTLVSPETRFDRWVKGDDAALEPDELAGLKLFVGKAACVNCHKGWRFTDEAFHDIGLRSADRGRGEVLNLPAADHAFKTPSLRERVWSAPYMHDGSLSSLEEVVEHYTSRVVQRPTLSDDLPGRIALSAGEKADLVAFLATLSSEDPPRPAMMQSSVSQPEVPSSLVSGTTRISQRGRRFSPNTVAIQAGEALTIVNDDTRTHQVRVDDPRMSFASGAQEPGETVAVPFAVSGAFLVTCGIHPEMRLEVQVSASPAK